MTWIDPLTRALHRQASQHGPVILMYHAVTPGKNVPTWPWAVSMRQFRDQLDFLATEGYVTPTMGELVAAPAQTWPSRTAVITFDDGYVNNLAACEELLKRGMRASWFIVSGSVGLPPRWPDDERPTGRLLNADELREMQANGMEIGSHTVSHVRLTGLDDVHLMQELTHSKATLEDLLGNAVNSFAYPYGDWDTRCATAVEKAGYATACTTCTGWALRDKDPYQLRRLTVFNNDSLSAFVRNLCFGDNQTRFSKLLRYQFNRLTLTLTLRS
ncbi:MAG: polysaccharide deacetylase [Hydrogenophilales bacterium 12-63-5]|nr:MAG: polysaccharide deacetylase [Hydrogenophilales bacterium 12-63-5]